MSDRQQQFDWPRAAQLHVIQHAALPDYALPEKPGRIVTGGAQKAVLVAIDHYARQSGVCRASLKTLAEVSQLNERTVRRALVALLARSLLCLERLRTNHCRIVWSELALLVPPQARDARDEQRASLRPAPASLGAASLGDVRRASKVDPRPFSTVDPGSPTVDPGSNKPYLTDQRTASNRQSAEPKTKTEWRRAADLLRDCGVEDLGVLRTSQQNGLTCDQVDSLIEHYRSRPGYWSPKALHYRLRTGLPFMRPEEGWPKPRGHISARTAKPNAQPRPPATAEAEPTPVDPELERRIDTLSDAEIAELLADTPLMLTLDRRQRHRPVQGVVRMTLQGVLGRPIVNAQ